MALTKVMTILVIFVLATPTFAQSNDHGHVSVLVSKTSLEFAKDYIIHKVISTTIPLQLPNIEKEVKIPIFGNVEMSLSNISIYSVDVHSSLIETGENGIVFSVTGAKANLSMDWSYTYRAAFFTKSDHGDASVNVNGMDLKITVTLVSDNGSLKIASQASDCKVNNIDVHINGGASWLYQGMVNVFQKTIMSTVENTVSKKIIENMKKLDSLLQSIPKQRKIDDYAAVNLTFTGNPVLRNSSIEVGIDGLFFLPNGKVSESPSSPSLFSNVSKMVAVSIQEEVFNSATLVYFIAKRMHVNIEESKNGSLLSTSDWKLIIPEMYKQYPTDKMMLNMSVTSPPAVKVTKNGIGATILLEIMLNVHDSGQVISVAHISSALNVACSARIAKNNLTGSLRLIDFNATMTSNKIGEPQSNYTQAATSRVLEALFLPYVNTHLNRGFPLQIPSSFMIENLDIVYVEGGVLVSSDIGTNLNYNTNI